MTSPLIVILGPIIASLLDLPGELGTVGWGLDSPDVAGGDAGLLLGLSNMAIANAILVCTSL
ncbi:MAG: hypothetical protein Hals2KO_20240 [Halioglobus sp.]